MVERKHLYCRVWLFLFTFQSCFFVFELLIFEQSESCESVGRFQDPDT